QGGQNPGGSESEELPLAARRARRELVDHNTPVHEDDDVRMEGLVRELGQRTNRALQYY
ncbi:unnamed protein product, partial [Scytosiphon promiscuus]